MRLEGQIAVVTGAARGLGRAIATQLAGEGAHLVIVDVDEAGASATAEQISTLGRHALVLAADVSNVEQVEEVTATTMSHFGRIDILVNNAGIFQAVPSGLPVSSVTEVEWDRMMSINLKGVFLLSKAVLAIMKAQRAGAIVNIGSLAGKLGGVVSGANYSVSKAGVLCLTLCLAKEGGPYGIRVNAVAPGQIDSPMTDLVLGHRTRADIESTIPLGRLGQAEDIARAVAFLASSDAAYITGEILDVNGGMFMD